jgi:O-acetyl-ADP-ribose deacetylase
MTKIFIIKEDITKLKVEAIVNASNISGLGCNIPNHCIDSAIHLAAGPLLLEECKKLGGIPTGIAKITNAYNLPSKYIIHVTGPQYKGKSDKYDFKMLSQCYQSCMSVAMKYGIKEIAFCCISTGLFGYPKKESATIALYTIKKWCDSNNYKFNKIFFCTFSDEDELIYKSLFPKIFIPF